MKTNYNYELIHDYLHGLLDSNTSKEMGELIKNDETARSIAEGIIRMEKEFSGDEVALDAYLENFQQKQLALVGQSKETKPIIKTAWFRMAASLLLLISVSAVVRMMIATPDLQTLVNQELSQPYPLSQLVRGDGDESAKEKAFQLYAQADFANASIYFEQAATDEKDNATISFYNGLSYLYAGKFEKAIALFASDVMKASRYSQQATWYWALALLKSGNKDAATEKIKAISKDKQNFKYAEALQMLKQLE
jgi:tetratricopeptide (TPR) repeat protein